MGNPFYDQLDWAIQGKKLRVFGDTYRYIGWGSMMRHGKDQLILHDATNVNTGNNVGSVFLDGVNRIEVIKPSKHIEYRKLDSLNQFPNYNVDFDIDEDVMQRCHRNRSSGTYPVIRKNGTILNGHKRIASAKAAGLEHHAVEVVSVTDEQALELFKLAHEDDLDLEDNTDAHTTADTTDKSESTDTSPNHTPSNQQEITPDTHRKPPHNGYHPTDQP